MNLYALILGLKFYTSKHDSSPADAMFRPMWAGVAIAYSVVVEYLMQSISLSKQFLLLSNMTD